MPQRLPDYKGFGAVVSIGGVPAIMGNTMPPSRRPAADAPAPPPSPQTDAPMAPAQASRLPLLMIVALALVLRVIGLGWALPNAGRLFSYHPDESVVTGASLAVNPFAFQLDPHFYNYGSLSLLLNSALIHLGELAGLVGPSPLPGVPSSGALLASRLVTVALSMATTVLLFHTGKRLYGARAGLVAAGLWAVAPLAVQHSHWATVDVPATFFVTGSLFFAARAATPDARPRDLLWAGVWAGLAAATKYNAGLVVLAGAVAWWQAGRTGRGAALLVGGTVAGFLVGCPAIVLNPGGVLAAIAFESNHVRTGHDIVFQATPPALIYHLSYNLMWGLGFPLQIVVLVATGYALYRRRPADLLLFAFALPYYLLIGLAQVKFARYTLPLFPPLFLWAGALLPTGEGEPSPRARIGGRVGWGAIGLATVYALLFSVGLDNVMTRPDTRDQAADYIRQHPEIKSVGFAKGPWFYSPTLGPLLACPYPAVAQKSALEVAPPPSLLPCVIYGSHGEPVPTEWETDAVWKIKPVAVALSEFEYADALRVGSPQAQTFIAQVRAEYPHREIFAQTVQVFGIPFTNLSYGGGDTTGLPTQKMPEDMRYSNPVTIVYTR